MSTYISTNTADSGNGVLHVTADTDSLAELKGSDPVNGTGINTSFKNIIKINNTYTATLGSSYTDFAPNNLTGNYCKQYVPVSLPVNPIANTKGFVAILYCPGYNHQYVPLISHTISFIEIGAPTQSFTATGVEWAGLAVKQGSSDMFVCYNTSNPLGSGLFNNRAGSKVFLMEVDYKFSGASVQFDHSGQTVNDIDISTSGLHINGVDLASIKFLNAWNDHSGYNRIASDNAFLPYVTSSGFSSGGHITPAYSLQNGFSINGAKFPNPVPSGPYELKIDRASVQFDYGKDAVHKPSTIGKNFYSAFTPHYKSYHLLGHNQSFVCNANSNHTLLIVLWDASTGGHLTSRVMGSKTSDGSYILFDLYVVYPGGSATNVMRINKSGNTFTFTKSVGSSGDDYKCLIFNYEYAE